MSPSNKKWLGLGIGLVITPITLLIAVASSGAGHGNYLGAWIIYPHEMLLLPNFGAIVLVLALFHYPIYGLLIGCIRGWKTLIAIPLIIVIFHFLALIAKFGSDAYGNAL